MLLVYITIINTTKYNTSHQPISGGLGFSSTWWMPNSSALEISRGWVTGAFSMEFRDEDP